MNASPLKKILVVEDEPDMRMMLAMELEGAGYQVFQAEDGEDGLKQAEAIKPDLILSDVLMPKLDGNQFMKKLRATEFGRDIPFLVLTARGKMRDYFEMVEADGFIEKPFEAEILLATVSDILKRAAQRIVDGDRLPKAKKDSVVPRDKRTVLPTWKTGVVLQEDAVDVSQPKMGDELSSKIQLERNRGNPAKKKKILFLENDSLWQKRLKILFAIGEYDASIVDTVARCLEEAVRLRPHLIILRSSLVEMEVKDVINILRGMSQIKDVPIIVIERLFSAEEEARLAEPDGDHQMQIVGQKLLNKIKEILES